MNKREREIFELYVFEYEYFRLQYLIMGKLLDENRVKDIFISKGWEKIYLYGGTYLETQLVRAISNSIEVIILSSNTEFGLETFHDDDMPESEVLQCITLTTPLIITDIKNAEVIKNKLISQVNAECIYFINELF